MINLLNDAHKLERQTDAYYLLKDKLNGDEEEEVCIKYYDALLTYCWYTRDLNEMQMVFDKVNAYFKGKNILDVDRIYNNMTYYLRDLSFSKKTIAIYCYMGSLIWDADSKCLNGSEEAVVYISRELIKYGYHVLIFGNPPSNSKHRLPCANPQYVYANKFDAYVNEYKYFFDALVIWRQYDKNMLSKYARKTYIWPHDMVSEKSFTKDRLIGVNGILWLSHYQHFSALKDNPCLIEFELENNFKIYGNGIIPEQFMQIVDKKKNSCIYASNYIRGLEILLYVWPKIKEAVPDASLKIYYGWNTWMSGSSVENSLKNIKNMLTTVKDVEECGSINHEELATKFLESEYWLYPCIYPETFCITAIKAQVSGCIPVCFGYGALKETVSTGYLCNDLFDTTAYTNMVIKAMTNEREQIDRKKIMEKYSWNKIASLWIEEFNK
jgi:glycosyltransferase involved in cell wall biosynthesis